MREKKYEELSKRGEEQLKRIEQLDEEKEALNKQIEILKRMLKQKEYEIKIEQEIFVKMLGELNKIRFSK